MPHSAAWIQNPENKRIVVELYRSAENLSAGKIARRLGTQIHNVTYVLKNNLDPEEYTYLKSLRWSIAKRGEKHPRWVKNRTTVARKRTVLLQRGERNYRQKMADLLGLDRLPPYVDVHHLDGDKTNDDLDNLILMTPGAHMRLHTMFGFRLQPKKRKVIMVT